MTTTTDPTTTAIDEEALGAFAEGLFGAGLQTMELTPRLPRPPPRALRGAARHPAAPPPSSPRRAGIDERYAREWLEQQADGRHPHRRRRRPRRPTSAASPSPRSTPSCCSTRSTPPTPARWPTSSTRSCAPSTSWSSAFRTGEGVAFSAYGLHDMQAGFTRPMFANEPRGRVDPGACPTSRPASRPASPCASPTSAAARAGPASTSPRPTRTSPSTASTSTTRPSPQARKHASERGVADRVHFEVQDVTDTSFGRTYDLVLAIEMVHDLADPVDALAAMERISRPDGAVLVDRRERRRDLRRPTATRSSGSSTASACCTACPPAAPTSTPPPPAP